MVCNRSMEPVRVGQSELQPLDDVDPSALYGLFATFSDQAQRRAYPFGEPDEDRILRAYASYCGRYRHPPHGLGSGDLVVEGIHVAGSVLLGVGRRAPYLATVPLPSLLRQEQLMVDDPAVPSVAEAGKYPSDWWPSRLVERVLGLELHAAQRTLWAELEKASPSETTPSQQR